MKNSGSFVKVDFAQRFEANYIPEPNSGCWLWTGGYLRVGYGKTWVDGRTVSAHRASWELHNGRVADGLWVLHRCDNRACVNPGHLFLGSLQDNTDDKCRKGRQARGARQGRSKLTSKQVIAIRADPRNGLTMAAEYGVSTALISAIRTGKVWKHI